MHHTSCIIQCVTACTIIHASFISHYHAMCPASCISLLTSLPDISLLAHHISRMSRCASFVPSSRLCPQKNTPDVQTIPHAYIQTIPRIPHAYRQTVQCPHKNTTCIQTDSTMSSPEHHMHTDRYCVCDMVFVTCYMLCMFYVIYVICYICYM